MKYQPVIGLEVHVELNTKSKMFCSCSADYFGKPPNTHTCPVCLGLPGALPYINQEAINKCIQIGLALNCKVAEKSIFERKNYFYPDLPKGYQISQYRWPLCVNGKLKIDLSTSLRAGNGKWIRINRAHQEEDTGQLLHHGSGTLIDFNRSGVPLVEIVTEPDFTSSEEVKDYAKKLQRIFRDLGVSNADMEKGDMRLEANVSIRPTGQEELPPYRVELKNINSFNFMVQAIEYEIKRQKEVLEAGKKLTQETRGWNEDRKETYLQRSKEEAHDYRYFPEPDLPELRIEKLAVKNLESNLPKLSSQKVEALQQNYGISKSLATTMVNQGTASLFEETVPMAQQGGLGVPTIANFIVNKRLAPGTTAQQIVDDIKAISTNLIADEEELGKLAKEAISENPKAVEDYKNGKIQALGFLVGQVVKLLPGVDPRQAKVILEERLSKGGNKNG